MTQNPEQTLVMAETQPKCDECGGKLIVDEQQINVFICLSCGKNRFIPPEILFPGVELDDFRIIRLIGVGGMGCVYLSECLNEPDRLVALKVLSPLTIGNDMAEKRFKQESDISSKLDHENIIRVFKRGIYGKFNYIAMEYADGFDLEELVTHNGPMDEQLALQHIRKIALALRYAWQEFRMLHRDIKPSNIILNSDGTIKLMDMGLAKSASSADATLTLTNQCIGTPHFISPEQARDSKNVDFRADIYSLGATFYYLITGRHPYQGDNPVEVISNMLKSELAPPETHNKNISRPASQLTLVMMANNRDERPAKWQSLINDIDRVINGQMPKTEPYLKGQIAPEATQLALKMSFWNSNKTPVTKESSATLSPIENKTTLAEKLTAALNNNGPAQKSCKASQAMPQPATNHNLMIHTQPKPQITALNERHPAIQLLGTKTSLTQVPSQVETPNVTELLTAKLSTASNQQVSIQPTLTNASAPEKRVASSPLPYLFIGIFIVTIALSIWLFFNRH